MPKMSPLGVFSVARVSLLFCQKGNVTPVTSTHIPRKYHFPMRFLIKTIFFHFRPKEKKIFSGRKKYHLSRYYKKDHVQVRFFWKDHLFRTFEKSIIFPGIFWEKSSFLSCLKNKIIFLGKRNILFPLIIQERSCSSEIFLERPSFQNIWKKKICFFVQCDTNLFSSHKNVKELFHTANLALNKAFSGLTQISYP